MGLLLVFEAAQTFFDKSQIFTIWNRAQDDRNS